MSNSLLYSVEERKHRWIRFMEKDTNVKHTYIVNCNEDLPQHPPFWPKQKKQEWIEYAWKLYNLHMERVEWLHDDNIPHLDLLTGTEIFAEAFGCKVHRAEGQMPCALHMISSASEVSKIKVPDLSVSPLAEIFEIADELKRRAGKDAIFRIPDIQSPMDIAALIWDKSDFYMALIDEPEAVKELAHKTSQLLTSFMDEWFKRYGTEFIAHWPAYYMNKGLTLSEDEIGVVNSSMYDEFFLPELVNLSNRYGGLGVHCCANAKHQWNGLKKISGLRLLNFNQPKEVTKEAFKYFADSVPMMNTWSGDGPAWTWVEQRNEGAWTCFDVNTQTKCEAKDAADRLWDACGR